MKFEPDELIRKRSKVEIVLEYITAFASAGSWAAILISIFLSEKYDNRLYVCGFMLLGILLSFLFITSVLRFALNLNARNWKKTYIASFSLCAALINVSIFAYDEKKSTLQTDPNAKVIEIGIEKARRKEYNEGRYFSLESKFGILRVYPQKFTYENIEIGSRVPMEIKIGGLGFIVATLK